MREQGRRCKGEGEGGELCMDVVRRGQSFDVAAQARLRASVDLQCGNGSREDAARSKQANTSEIVQAVGTSNSSLNGQGM